MHKLTSKNEFNNIESCNCGGACSCINICIWWPQDGDSISQTSRTQASLY